VAEKTEAPTPRRREEARSKGQGVGRSSEMTMGLTLGVGLLALSMLLPAAGNTLVNATRNSIINVSPRASNSQLLAQTGTVFTTLLALILPLACLVMVAGVAANLVSGGLVLSPRRSGST